MIIRLDISYDGTHYYGWQKQPNTDQCIQTQIEIALRKLFQNNITTIGSGRTDAGVHAYQQVLHFELPGTIDIEKYKICSALNSLLPNDISINKAFIAPDDFHAMANAVKKYYVYRIYTHPFKYALLERFHHHYTREFNLAHINQLSERLVGKKDFASFQSVGTPVKSTIREVYYSFWKASEENVFEYHIMGSGFLKQMVRNIVGTLLHMEARSEGPQKLDSILEAKNRSQAGPTAPANGLSMKKVFYPDELVFTDISR